MATYGKKLLDVNGNVILPKTRSSLVYMDDNSTVEDAIKKILSGETPVERARSLPDNNILRNYSLYATSTSGITRKTPIAIWDDVLEDSRPVDRAFYDANGDQINTTYARRDGTTFSGEVVVDAKVNASGTGRNVIHNPFRVGTSKSEFFRNIMVSKNSVYQEGYTTVIGSRE